MTIEFILLGVFLLVSAFFSGTETAYTSLSPVQLQGLKAKNPKRGKQVEKLYNKPEILLTTVLIGNNLVNIAASALATTITTELFGSQALGAMTGVLTLIVLIFSEVTPKQIAISHNEGICLFTVPIIRFLSIIFRPFIIFINFISNRLSNTLGGKKRGHISEEYLIHALKAAHSEGAIKEFESNMAARVFRMNDVNVKAVMTHRTAVFSLDSNIKLQDAVQEILEKGFSRIPVYKENSETITGILVVRDILQAIIKGENPYLSELAREPIYVSERKKINQMLALFKKEPLNMAIVLDEYGGLAGIVTLEDLAEEILGELGDEDDILEAEQIIKQSDNLYTLQGDAPIHMVADALGLRIAEDIHAQTIGGFIIEQLDGIPMPGEVIEINEGTFSVNSVVKRQIISLSFKRKKTGD